MFLELLIKRVAVIKAEIINGRKNANPTKLRTVAAFRYIPVIFMLYKISLCPNRYEEKRGMIFSQWKAKKTCIDTIKTCMKLLVSPYNLSKRNSEIIKANIVDIGSQGISNMNEFIQCKKIIIISEERNISKVFNQDLNFK
jgi:hypothetical protein